MALAYWCVFVAHCLLVKFAGSIMVEEFYPFGRLAGDAALILNDDGVSPPINLQTKFPFFDENRKILYVNNNGLLSFDNPVTSFSSQSFPIAGRKFRPAAENILIAPYWADVDTRTAGSGTVWYRQTTNATLLARARQEIIGLVLLYPEINRQDFHPTLLVIATWDEVGYYNRNFDKTNTFQCVLVTDGFVSYVFFLYAEGGIQWTTGDNNGEDGFGGTPAQVGLNAGDPVRFQSIPFSQTDDIIDIDEIQGNTGRKGVWAYRVDAETITEGTCTTDGSIALLTNQGSILGGTATVVIGPCFNSTQEIFCDFHSSIANESVQAVFLDSRRVLCISPALSRIGRTAFRLIGDNYMSKSIDFYSLPFTSYHKVGVDGDSLLVRPRDEFILNWSPNDIIAPDVINEFTVNINLHLITSNGIDEVANLATNVPNEGSIEITVPLLNETGFVPAVFQVSLSNSPGTAARTPGVWSMVVYYGSVEPSRQSCIDWSYETDKREAEATAINSLINCPCTVLQAQAPNSGFKQQQNIFLGFQNTGAEFCFYQSAIEGTSARQCCYNSGGELIRGPTSGGHSDFYSPESTPSSPYTAMQQHVERDIVPFIHCCKSAESLCIAYYEYRASADNICRHAPQSSAFVYGDPHFITFDGFKYTFNGKGDFVFIETRDNVFTMHGRMREASTNGVLKPASVVSAVVMKQKDSDTIQLETSRRVVDILINGIRINFNSASEIAANNVTVTKFNVSIYNIQFSSGIYVKVEETLGHLSPIVVSLPDELRDETFGLLGYFNGIFTDDMLPRGGLMPFPAESSLQEIHEGFGLSWTIGSQSDSIFYYHPYKAFSEFFDPAFPAEFEPVFFDETLEMQAYAICNDDPFCIFDIAVTSSIELGVSTRLVGESAEMLDSLALPIVCNPPCKNGTCVANNTCNCQAGFEGDNCEARVLQGGCVTDVCQNEGTCIHLAEDSICLCPPYAVGLNCEQLQDTGIMFEIECISEVQNQNIQIVCTANLPIESAVYSFNNNFMALASLTVILPLNNLELGNNTIVVTATSVFNDTETSTITKEVEPLDLKCTGDAVSEHLIIEGCESRNELISTTCSLNNITWGNCDFPLDVDITMMQPGQYTLEIAVTDVYNNHEDYSLQYSKPPLDIQLINSSPRVNGDTVIADFILNRPRATVPVICYVTNQPKQDCSNGRVVFTNLVAGTYTLRLVAKAINGERYVERRRIYIGESENRHCAVHLINEGVQVDGRRVTIQFVGTRAVNSYSCTVDGRGYRRCRSPYRLFNVEPGRHTVRVRPQCNTPNTHILSTQFNVQN